VALADARTPPGDLVAAGSVDVLVTSPPYLGVYDYVQHHLLRSAVLGFDARDFARGEVGSRREQRRQGGDEARARYRADLAAVLGAWRTRLRPGGLAAVMIGDGQLGAAILPAAPLMAEVAAESGWELVARASQPRPAFIPGSRAPGFKEEHLVLLRAASGPR
jgi:DNA modification methylase